MAKIVIRNLTKTYSGGAVVALEDINLEVAAQRESLYLWVRAAAARRRCCASSIVSLPVTTAKCLIDGVPVTQPRPDVAMVFNTSACFRGSGWRKTSPMA